MTGVDFFKSVLVLVLIRTALFSLWEMTKVIVHLIKVFRFVPSFGRSFHFQFQEFFKEGNPSAKMLNFKGPSN